MRIHSLLARLWGIFVPPDDLETKPARRARVVPVRDADAAEPKLPAK